MQNIVLLHGALGASQDLRALSAALKNDGLQPHCFSFSGHGKTSDSVDFGISSFTIELENFISDNKLGKTNIFGYSMGGYVALNLALKPDHPVNRIITLGSKFNWSEASADKELKQLDPQLIMKKVPSFAEMLREKHGENWPALMLKTGAMMKKIGEENLLNPETIKKISIPVLIGIGDKDQMVSLDETVQVYKTLPSAAMYMLPGTRHQLDTVNVKLLSRLICDFTGMKTFGL